MAENAILDKYVTAEDLIARYPQIFPTINSIRSARRSRRKHRLPAYRISRDLLFNLEEVDAWILQNKAP